MVAGVIVALLILSGATLWVAWPLFRPESAREMEEPSPLMACARELESRREMLLSTLRDLDEDREANKLDPQDHAEIRGRLAVEAADVLRRIDENRAALDSEERRRFPVIPHPAGRPAESADD